MGIIGWTDKGQLDTLDFWCLYAGWDGGTIHDAFRAFASWPMREKDAFCSALIKAIDAGHINDLENGFAATFTRLRLGIR